MMKAIAVSIILAGFGSAAFAGDANPAEGEQGSVTPEVVKSTGLNFSSLYVGGAAASSNIQVTSGGRNTVGPFDNVNCLAPSGPGAEVGGFPADCTSSQSGAALSVFVGFEDVYTINPRTTLRAEIELSKFDDGKYITGSFPGAPGPFTFFYRTSVSDHQVAFANLYVDYEYENNIVLFAGGGIGVSKYTLETSDFVVEADAQVFTNIAFNIGAGASYEASPGIDLFAQYRYINFGVADAEMEGVGGDVPAGNYTLGSHSNEFRIGARYSFN